MMMCLSINRLFVEFKPRPYGVPAKRDRYFMCFIVRKFTHYLAFLLPVVVGVKFVSKYHFVTLTFLFKTFLFFFNID